MSKAPSDNQYFGTEKTMKILFKLAPPVMLAQLIQSLYNIVDSFFIGKFSGYALTALSVIYTMPLLICAVAVGTGVGVNTVMARFYGQNRTSKAINTARIGTVMEMCIRDRFIRFGGVSNSFYKTENTAIGLAVLLLKLIK